MGKTIITYKDEWAKIEHVVELGRRYEVNREGAAEDMAISRTIAYGCPVKVCMLLRTNGDFDVWYVEFTHHENPYWHFDHLSDEHAKTRKPTEAQIQAIIRLRDNIDIYGNLGGHLGKDIIEWAFGEDAAREALYYHT